MAIALLIAYLGIVLFHFWLDRLNVSHMKKNGDRVPEGFAGAVDAVLLKKISAYTIERMRLSAIESLVQSAILLLFLFGGPFAAYDRWAATVSGSFVLNGLVFFLVLGLAGGIIDIPFSLYRNFSIEARHGFNAMTLRLWLTDLLKSLVISGVIGSLMVAGGLSIVQASPGWWWFWGWLFFLGLSVFLMYLSPALIEPLFFTFTPLAEDGLAARIRDLMDRAGIAVSRIFQVDASRRSRHSNAYFTGIGRVKRIVLFDTLLAQMSGDEVLAVLAHEAGHWKKRHVLKRIVLTEVLALAGLATAYQLVRSEALPRLPGIEQASFYAQMVIIMFLSSIVLFPLTPLLNALSRRGERQADRFARDLTGMPGAMASALVKLSRENLSNLHPHPLYAWFHYSHPPVVERVCSLRDEAAGAGDAPALSR